MPRCIVYGPGSSDRGGSAGHIIPGARRKLARSLVAARARASIFELLARAIRKLLDSRARDVLRDIVMGIDRGRGKN